MEKEDKELVEKFLNGDKKSLEVIVNRHLKPVFNYVYRITSSSNETEDIVQEVFIKVWKNISKFNPDQNFKTWLFAIARNTTIDWLRKRKNISFSKLDSINDEEGDKTFEETLRDAEPLPDEIFMKKEIKKDLEKALTKIRPDFKEIMLLHYTENLTFQEISLITQKPLNTVKSQHRRALESLRKLIIT